MFDGGNFVRVRNVGEKKVSIKDNRVINLLQAMEDAMNRYNGALDDKEKAKQKKRYDANFNSLMNMIDKFNEREENNRHKTPKIINQIKIVVGKNLIQSFRLNANYLLVL